jgi:hypothetical protein
MSTTIDAAVSGTGMGLRIVTDVANSNPMSVYLSYPGQAPLAVRGLDEVTGYPPAQLVLDYAVPFNTVLTYEVVVRSPTGSTLDYATAQVQAPADNRAWLRDVLYPQSSMPVNVESHPGAKTEARTALLSAVGRANVIAVSDIRSGRSGTSAFVTFTDGEADMFARLVDSGHVLLLTGPADWRLGPVYMSFLGVENRRIGGPVAPERRWVVEWVQVDPPEALVVGAPRTYAQLLTDFPFYLDARGTSYADLLYPPPGAVLRRWAS